MGSRHLEQMFDEALDLDERALASVLLMLSPLKIAAQVYETDYWEKCPIDELFDKARGLLELDEDFTEAVRKLIANRQASVIVFDTRVNKPRHVYEPELFRYEPRVDTHTFFLMVKRLIAAEN